MKHSIYFRNFIAMALIVLMSFTVLGGLSIAWNYRRATTEISESIQSTLEAAARYVTMQYVYYGMDLDDLDLSMWLATTSGISGYDLLIADADGAVGACSERDFRHLGKEIPGPAIEAVMEENGGLILSTLGHLYPETRRVAGTTLITVMNGETYAFGYIFVSSEIAAYRQEWRQFTGSFILIAINVMVLAFVISFVTTKRQAEPLGEMAGAARRFARGDFSMRVKDYGRLDEIGELAQAFNAMADSLENSENNRRELIANLSHELKTPMTVITGFVDGILDGTIPQENEARYLGVISSETRRLSRLVKGMLDMSRLQSSGDAIMKESFDITEITRLALLSLNGKIEERNLDVEAGLPEEAIITRGDKDSITQVVYNLIDNAIKFSSPGGFITIELWKQGPRAYVSIENRGDVIPADELPHIFERFHKADRSRGMYREGVGLGLYIVKTILDSHNEDIFVTSRDGVTKFMFTLTIV